MGRTQQLFFKYIIPRKKGVLIRVCLISLTLWCLACGWWLSDPISQALLPTIVAQHLDHFRINRNLKSYLDHIEVLIEPSSVPCQDVPLLVLVTSSPTHFEQRQAIRKTWGPYFPTYFILGLNVHSAENVHYVENYAEAKQHNDLIIYNFQDHYQNLTLKTALMLQWTLGRCSPQMLFKTDDDILINPWMMNQVLQEYRGRDLVGRVQSCEVLRDRYHKWYLPRWLYARDFVPEYLSGAGYLINGKHIKAILTAAYKVPMINLEDIYFTYLVSKQELNLSLTHDYRLSPYKPWAILSCAYWGLASIHDLQPKDMINKWENIKYFSNKIKNNETVCNYFLNNVWIKWFLYGA